MSRDYTQLRVFQSADELVVDVYDLTRSLPLEERFGLQAQIRRAAVSIPTNIVEGSVRRSDAHYLTYLETAVGSACEVRYLLGLTVRRKMLDKNRCTPLEDRYTEVIKSLVALIARISDDLDRYEHRKLSTGRRR